MDCPTRPITAAEEHDPLDAAYIRAPRTPSDLCSAFLTECRPFLSLLEVMPEPVVLGPNHFNTFTKINDRLATLTWKVTVSMRGELLDIAIESVAADGEELPVDFVTDAETEFAQCWAAENGDAFPVEGGE